MSTRGALIALYGPFHPDHMSQSHQVNLRDSLGNTPAHHAAAAGAVQSLKVLIENGADLSVRQAGPPWAPRALTQPIVPTPARGRKR